MFVKIYMNSTYAIYIKHDVLIVLFSNFSMIDKPLLGQFGNTCMSDKAGSVKLFCCQNNDNSGY